MALLQLQSHLATARTGFEAAGVVLCCALLCTKECLMTHAFGQSLDTCALFAGCTVPCLSAPA